MRRFLTHVMGIAGPTADAGDPQSVSDVNREGSPDVTLDGSGSTAGDRPIVSYSWRLNGSEIATGVNPTVGIPVGVNSVTLRVTDSQGLYSDDVVVITVTAPPGILYGSPLIEVPFDEGTGQTLADEHGNLTTATLGLTSGADADDPAWETYGISLAAGDTVRLGEGQDVFDIAMDSCTLGFVVWVDDYTVHRYLLSHRNDSIGFDKTVIYLRIVQTSGRLQLYWEDAIANLESAGAVGTGAWLHVIVKLGSENREMIVNEVELDSDSETVTFFHGVTARDLLLGEPEDGVGDGVNRIAYFYYYERETTAQEDTDNHAALQALMTARGETLP